MKRRREGALHEPVYSATKADDFFEVIAHSLPAFADAEDFLAKATALARRMRAPADSLRGEYSAALARYVAELRRWLRAGADPRVIDDAVSAALALAALCGEVRDDAKTKRVKTRAGKVSRGKVTRTAYLTAKQAMGGKRAAMAKMLDVTERGLRKWERENLS